MSRLIVKNLPDGMKEDRLRKHFGQKGKITDCSLKYKDGHFRKFAFVGYKTEAEAQSAIKEFNNTFINASKIQVEIARDFGTANKPRAWSKYSKDSSANQKAQNKSIPTNQEEDIKQKKKKTKKKEAVDNLLGELKDDPSFGEFLDAHQNVGVKPVWSNDGVRPDRQKSQDVAMDDDSSEDEDGYQDNKNMEVDAGDEDDDKSEETPKAPKQKELSDLEYLKSKVSASLSDSSSEESEKEVEDKKKKKKTGKTKEKSKGEAEESSVDVQDDGNSAAFMVRMKGMSASTSQKAIKEFFHPLEIVKSRLPCNAKSKPLGVAFVGFKSEKDRDQALLRNKNYIGGARVFLNKMKAEVIEEKVVDKPRPWETKNKGDENAAEDVSETGRLFIRNLSYACTEEDLEAEFKKFGPLTETSMPIDSLTKKVKGFAFITFMIPEHAVKAHAAMDGKVFQGRMLHVLPGKEKKEDTDENLEGSSYKKKKQAETRNLAGSSHNWNSLFLGTNAVADVLARKYKAEKSDILDSDIKGSLGVRMALGETQIVSETRDFLIAHGVSLDSFSQPKAPRSKTVILVKNLPAGTMETEIRDVFSQHGTLGRVLLPPSGITAVVEYLAPTEARAGFRRLAYTKFRHVPLYLEWAPMEVFTTPAGDQPSEVQGTGQPDTSQQGTGQPDTSQQGTSQQDITGSKPSGKVKDDSKKPTSKNDDSSEEEEVVAGSTLFVKNLNFDTTDEELNKHFAGCSTVKSSTVAKKKDVRNPGQMLSMGYGFVEFVGLDGAEKAVKELQHSKLAGHTLELKISNRTTASDNKKMEKRKQQPETKQKTTKILVKNIPFEAKKKEVEELFKVFGQLKVVRLPKKMHGSGAHRGFGFVDFVTRQDAKRAFEALCHSTHLYGRRLVLEWAAMEDDINDIRKRTADHYHGDDAKKRKFTKASLLESLDTKKSDKLDMTDDFE